MLRNYFKTAWRILLRQKGYAGINILGLAIGIAACLLILQYVSFELSFENFHVNKDRIYRVHQDRYDKGKLSTQWSAGAYGVGNAFKDAIPEIEDYVKVVGRGDLLTEINNQPVKIQKTFYASASFFKIFTYTLIAGDPNTALKEPFTAAIPESTAKTIFGTTDAVGKTIQFNRRRTYTVTAVFKDPPVNTQLKPGILLSYASFVQLQGPDNNPETAWTWDGCLTYLLLRKDADPAKVEAKFPPIVEKNVGEDMKKFNASVTYSLQPLTDIHLYSHYMGEPGVNGDGNTVYLLLG